MSPALRKLMLTVHVTSSVGWLGAIVAYLALNVAALGGRDEQTIRAAYLMMERVALYALVPMAVASLITGIRPRNGSRRARPTRRPAWWSWTRWALR